MFGEFCRGLRLLLGSDTFVLLRLVMMVSIIWTWVFVWVVYLVVGSWFFLQFLHFAVLSISICYACWNSLLTCWLHYRLWGFSALSCSIRVVLFVWSDWFTYLHWSVLLLLNSGWLITVHWSLFFFVLLPLCPFWMSRSMDFVTISILFHYFVNFPLLGSLQLLTSGSDDQKFSAVAF